MDHWRLGTNAGGVENHVWFDEPTGQLYCTDIQPKSVNDRIAAENKLWRDTEKPVTRRPPDKGRKIASIPITMWQQWRSDWKRHHSDRWTWQTFELLKLAQPENGWLLTTNDIIPTYGPRDRPLEA